MTRHIPGGQFFRYILIGVWNRLFGYGTFSGFTALLDRKVRYGYVLASLLSGLLNITVAFFAHKWFVFKTRANYLSEWFRCVAVYGTGIAVSAMLLPPVVFLQQKLFGPTHYAPYIAGAVILSFQVLYNFLALQRFSFRRNSGVNCGPARP